MIIDNSYISNVLSKIEEIAKDISPDYPGIETCDHLEQLWAIKSAYFGLNKACEDLQYILIDLMGKLKLSREQMFKYCMILIEEKDKKEDELRRNQH